MPLAAKDGARRRLLRSSAPFIPHLGVADTRCRPVQDDGKTRQQHELGMSSSSRYAPANQWIATNEHRIANMVLAFTVAGSELALLLEHAAVAPPGFLGRWFMRLLTVGCWLPSVY